MKPVNQRKRLQRRLTEKQRLEELLVEAIENVAPLKGIALTDIINYAGERINLGRAQLKDRFRRLLKYRSRIGNIIKIGRFRYGFRSYHKNKIKFNDFDKCGGILCDKCGVEMTAYDNASLSPGGQQQGGGQPVSDPEGEGGGTSQTTEIGGGGCITVRICPKKRRRRKSCPKKKKKKKKRCRSRRRKAKCKRKPIRKKKRRCPKKRKKSRCRRRSRRRKCKKRRRARTSCLRYPEILKALRKWRDASKQKNKKKRRCGRKAGDSAAGSPCHRCESPRNNRQYQGITVDPSNCEQPSTAYFSE